MNKSTKITELVPAMYYRSRRVGGVRLVHLRKVTKIKIGNNYHGEPVYSTYPEKTTLCGVKNTELEAPTAEGAVLEPTCTKCKRLGEQSNSKGETLGDAYHRLIGLGFVPANEGGQIAMLRVLEKVWDEAVRHA